MAYEPSLIKRVRATNAEVSERRDALYAIVAQQRPMTVRQVFYAATVRGIVEKTERGYRKVQVDLTEMRRSKHLPYSWLADSTRWMRKPPSYGSMAEALEETARLYRRDLWVGAGQRVEVWLEKDALAGVIYDITHAFDVPLMVTRGYASLSFLYGAAEAIAANRAPTFVYHLGDFDPSGVDAARNVREQLRQLAPRAEIAFERLAVTEEQIARMRLPTRPTKASDTRARRFGPVSVELDAIEAHALRDLVRHAIERHLPAHELDQLKQVEAEERSLLHGLVGLVAEE